MIEKIIILFLTFLLIFTVVLKYKDIKSYIKEKAEHITYTADKEFNDYLDTYWGEIK